jgi:hypothetical protein
MTQQSPPASRDTSSPAGSAVRSARRRLATVVWLLAAACATLLVAGALCVVLGADRDDPAVSLVLEAADRVDLGVLSREAGVVEFSGVRAEEQDALVTWGLAAVAWLVAGRVLAGLVRPRDVAPAA